MVKPTDIVTIYVYFKIPGMKEWIEQSTRVKIPYVNWSKVSESIIAAGLNIEQKSSSLKFQQLKAHFDSLLLTNKIDPSTIIDKKSWLKQQINFVNGDYSNPIKRNSSRVFFGLGNYAQQRQNQKRQSKRYLTFNYIHQQLQGF